MISQLGSGTDGAVIPGGPAPLDAVALARSLLPFGESRMLPWAAYVDDDVFAWEECRFFRGGWMCVGRSEDVAAPGDQRAESVGKAGVFLVRDDDGRLRGFSNACRHRGHELLPCGESRNLHIVVCPYHSWSYRLDGSLRHAPGFDELHSFDPDRHGLVELPTDEWHGLVFVDASGGAGPLAEHFAGVEELVAPYEPERLRVAGHHDYVVAANWKILTENYQECYHCSMIHPELCSVSPPRSGANYNRPDSGAWVGGWMDLRDGADTMSISGRSGGTTLRGLDAEARRVVVYLALFPNVLMSLHPDYVMTHLLTPLGPDRTRIRCSWSFSPEDLGRDGFDPAYAVDFWDITNRQDWRACESVQRGMEAETTVPGPLSPDEDGVYQFVTMLARAYRGERVHAGTVPVS
jgi:glycine betaine catabolism A